MEATTQPSIHQRFDTLARSDLVEFKQFFRRLYKAFPDQAAEACLLYIATHGLDTAAGAMTYWLVSEANYVEVLLDVDSLPADSASRAISVLKELDPQFLFKFVKGVTALSIPAAILRALGLMPALGDYSILIPWLRRLGQQGDIRVRSRSAKLLCELRPNKGLIERQMQSADPRVRAGAMEALWTAKTEDARSILRAALSDPNHRVLANALVGLYRMGETQALTHMMELCAHKQHLFRAAMAWALGFVKDQKAIPALRDLTRDPSLVVRKRALGSLAILDSSMTPEDEVAKDISLPSESELEPADEAGPAAPPTFDPFLFK